MEWWVDEEWIFNRSKLWYARSDGHLRVVIDCIAEGDDEGRRHGELVARILFPVGPWTPSEKKPRYLELPFDHLSVVQAILAQHCRIWFYRRTYYECVKEETTTGVKEVEQVVKVEYGIRTAEDSLGALSHCCSCDCTCHVSVPSRRRDAQPTVQIPPPTRGGTAVH